jgi:hypothetical protein
MQGFQSGKRPVTRQLFVGSTTGCRWKERHFGQEEAGGRRASAAPTDHQVLMNPTADSSAPDQADVTRRYNRMARIYDLYDAPMEIMGTKKRRQRLLSKAEGSVLEAGIGTGKNLRYFPTGVGITGIDVSSQMLARAKCAWPHIP